MSKGVVLFAFNSPNYNYYKMAEHTAKRANHFLNLPVTLITDSASVDNKSDYKFDNIIEVESDKDNQLLGKTWINKGRYQCYDLSPYDETLLLDVDYMINSDRLLDTFNCMDDFCCHESISYMMSDYNKQEYIAPNSLPTLWATVVSFKKTKRTKQIFESLKMIQKNYRHYANIYHFDPETYRNDFGLTLAWRLVNGHVHVPSDIIPWNLMHIGLKTAVYKNTNDVYNTQYTVVYDKWMRNKIKKEYITIKDIDFHIINKDICVELFQ